MKKPELNFERAREKADEAFAVLAEALEMAEAHLIEVGTTLAMEGRFAEVGCLDPWRVRIARYRSRLEQMNEQFLSAFDEEQSPEESTQDDSGSKLDVRTRTRGPNKTLTVTLWDGRVVRETTAAQTFSIVLGELGWDKVKALGIELSGIPLVSREFHNLYDVKKMVYQQMDGWYIMTNSSTDRKVQLLQDISEALGRTLSVTTEVD